MKAFETIGTAQVAKSAEQARSMGFLGPNDGITMNRDRLLADAKRKVLDLSENYAPPVPRTYRLPGPTGLAGLNLALSDLALSAVTPHDAVVATSLAGILTGGNTDITVAMEEDDILSYGKRSLPFRTPSRYTG